MIESVRVSADNDDCIVYWNNSAWIISLTTSANQVGHLSQFQTKIGSGMRFLNVTIPNGVFIVTAHLTLQSVGNYGIDTVNSRISGEDIGTAATFSTYANYNARVHTSAVVDWDGIGHWTTNTDYDSPEIKTIIKEIIDRGDWSSGNDLVIFWDDLDDRSSHDAGDCRRVAKSHNSDPANAPILSVTYTELLPPTPVTDGRIIGKAVIRKS